MEDLFGVTPQIFEDNYQAAISLAEIGEEGPPEKAVLFKGGTITLISGKSSSLYTQGFSPFPESHLTTEQALLLTKALANLHATSIVESLKKDTDVIQQVETEILLANCAEYEGGCPKIQSNRKESFSSFINAADIEENAEKALPLDPLTTLISRPHILEANLSILVDNFKHEGVTTRVIDKLLAVKSDVHTLTQFLQFASAMQSSTSLPSIGPICMADVWLPNVDENGEDSLVLRFRGGPSLRAPPLRDIAWIWLTLLRPNVLRERYVELCETYCTSFNESISRLEAENKVEELSLLDVMKDLGENFLHGFLTMVHKFVVSGVWALDRQLHDKEGITAFADSISFLVDNGIVGPIFIS